MILLTGGTGLVGSHILMALLKTEEKVRAIHRADSNLELVKEIFSYYLSLEKAEEHYSRIEWFIADLEDIPALENAFRGIKKVVHSAALVSFDSSLASRLRKVNIEGTANIANLCIAHKIEKLCYISSIATMDLNVGEKFVSENFTWHPERDHTDYAISKHGAEIEVWRASQEGVPVIILNPGVILGPGFWKKGTGQIFSKVAKGLRYHFPKTTGFVGVKDVALAAVMAISSSIQNEQYIVVSENRSFKDVLDEVAIHLNKPKPKKKLRPWMIYVGWLYQSFLSLFGKKKIINREDYKSLFEDTFYSNQKIKQDLNIEFTPLIEVIKETAELYRRDHQSQF